MIGLFGLGVPKKILSVFTSIIENTLTEWQEASQKYVAEINVVERSKSKTGDLFIKKVNTHLRTKIAKFKILDEKNIQPSADDYAHDCTE